MFHSVTNHERIKHTHKNCHTCMQNTIWLPWCVRQRERERGKERVKEEWRANKRRTAAAKREISCLMDSGKWTDAVCHCHRWCCCCCCCYLWLGSWVPCHEATTMRMKLITVTTATTTRSTIMEGCCCFMPPANPWQGKPWHGLC